MNLRTTHDRRRFFDAVLVVCACICVLLWPIGIIGLVVLSYAIFIEPRRLTVQKYREALVREPKIWIRIAFLSDFHAGGFQRKNWYAKIAREVHAQHPDLIVLGGDYVVDRVEAMEELAPLAELTAPLGKVFVLGNHDFLDRPQEIRAALTSYGYTDVTNHLKVIERAGRALDVQGVDDHWYGNPKKFRRASKDRPHLTISHEPDILLDLKEGDTDLILSGHTHGGQIRLPWIGAIWPIPAKLGRLVDHGRKRMHGITCVISNGLGETDGRIRLLAPPQIVIVEVGI
jgi:uncharacterized protein